MVASGKNASTTRGVPFARGNPGRPKGARHRLTVLAEALLEVDLEAVIAKVVRKAKAGDMVAAKLILDRVMPPRRGRPVRFKLPVLTTVASIVEAQAAVSKAMAAGELSPDEAMQIAAVIELQRAAIATHDHEQRLAAIEERQRSESE